MPKRPRAYHRPQDLAEALNLLTQPQTVPLAGGTKLLAKAADVIVVDLQSLGLSSSRMQDGMLLLGATTTLSELDDALSELQEEGSPAQLLSMAIHRSGPNTYRHAATIGGSLASRIPDSELLAALLVLEASMTLHGNQATSISVADYLAADELPRGLITEVAIPWTKGKGSSERVARTPADMPIVSVTIWQPEGESPRAAATGTAVRPERVAGVEDALSAGNTAASRTAASAAAKASSRHPGDFRGSSGYRADMAAVLTQRVCENIA